MAMTLRLSDSDSEALRMRAAADGVSMQEVAQRAIQEYLTNRSQRLTRAIELVASADAALLERLSK